MVLQGSGIYREGNIWWGGGGKWALEAAPSAPPAPAFPGHDREHRPRRPVFCALRGRPAPGCQLLREVAFPRAQPYHPSTHSSLPGTDRASRDETEARGCGSCWEAASVHA